MRSRRAQTSIFLLLSISAIFLSASLVLAKEEILVDVDSDARASETTRSHLTTTVATVIPARVSTRARSSNALTRSSFYNGARDTLATQADINKLRAGLPRGTVVFDKMVDFGHLDFTWASNAHENVYNDLIQQIRQYEGRGY
ncbi:hypothetical protein PF008_g12878 [Phytophthora fragariae]|uniref:AB hydrolase-1 domain-containing protein n=1 Tax=Phytophthora fragariae TaxID=53985 RepID=A0A6G0RM26_9STRA|nr:hypothetical protein PF008_g12878 [Phytophthora fragariae]